MDTNAFLNYLQEQPDYSGQIAHVEHVPPRRARFDRLDEPLSPELQRRLEVHRLDSLYTHQASAVNRARQGKNIMVATASAKIIALYPGQHGEAVFSQAHVAGGSGQRGIVVAAVKAHCLIVEAGQSTVGAGIAGTGAVDTAGRIVGKERLAGRLVEGHPRVGSPVQGGHSLCA